MGADDFRALERTDDYRALGRAAKRRREQLGITQEQMQDHGGPSPASVRNIEKGVARPRGRTMLELDRALGWKPGTSEAIVAGTADPDPTTWVELARTYTVGTAGETNTAGPVHHERTVTDTAGTADSVTMSGTGYLNVEARAIGTAHHFALAVQTPRRVAEDRIREVREQRGWTHEQLAQQCRNLGAHQLTSEAIAAIESHELGVLDINDVMAICYALDVAPVHVLAPIKDADDADDHRINAAPDRYLRPDWYREWIKGTWAPSDMDAEWYFWRTAPIEEWHPKELTIDEIERASEAIRQARMLEAMTQPHRAHPDFRDRSRGD